MDLHNATFWRTSAASTVAINNVNIIRIKIFDSMQLAGKSISIQVCTKHQKWDSDGFELGPHTIQPMLFVWDLNSTHYMPGDCWRCHLGRRSSILRQALLKWAILKTSDAAMILDMIGNWVIHE